MTRLFDALRKAGSAGPGVPPAPVPPPPRAGRADVRVVRAVPAARALAGERARHVILPLVPVSELPTDVTREMTSLRVRVEASLSERIPRTVMFLSPQGGEGTSAVTAQFARSLASEASLRVLVVDAHARRFAYTAGRVGPLRVDSSSDGAREGPGGRALELMPLPEAVAAAGGAAPQVLGEILRQVASAYDWILIDGPPVLESPDAAPLATAADGVIVVVQAGRTKRPVLTRAVDLVQQAGGRALGIVLNRRRLEIPEFIYRRI